jgi:DNA-directed RNA polymerase subunit N (RpoN/RPB10)
MSKEKIGFEIRPIRCLNCNKPIENLAPKYEKLLEMNGGNIKQALDDLNLMRQCCRISMMNPTFIFHDLNDRSLIESRELEKTKVKEIKEIPSLTSGSAGSAGSAGGTGGTGGSEKKPIRSIPGLTKKVEQPKIPIEQMRVSSIPNTDKDEIFDITDASLYNDGMTIYLDDNNERPVKVGLSTIKEPFKFLDQEVDVGCGYKVKVLSNRQYLAQ